MASKEIRCIVAPLTFGHVLVPNIVVAELMDFAVPEPLRRAPDWILGELVWNGWQVPVISFEHLVSDSSANTVTAKARILIIKTLGESLQVNYIGLIIQGLPKLKKITADNLLEKLSDELPDGVFSEVSIDDLKTMIPELGSLTRLVEDAAYGN
jgi:chemosensory pili system protein ChpC